MLFLPFTFSTTANKRSTSADKCSTNTYECFADADKRSADADGGRTGCHITAWDASRRLQL